MALRNAASRAAVYQEPRYDPVAQLQQKQVLEYEEKKKNELQQTADIADLMNNTAKTWSTYITDANNSYTSLVNPYMERSKKVSSIQAKSEVNSALNSLRGIEVVGKNMEDEVAKYLEQLAKPTTDGDYTTDKPALKKFIDEYVKFGYDSPDATEEEKQAAWKIVYNANTIPMYAEGNPQLKWALDLAMKQGRYFKKGQDFNIFNIDNYAKKLLPTYAEKEEIEGKSWLDSKSGRWGNTTTSASFSDENYAKYKSLIMNREEAKNTALYELTDGAIKSAEDALSRGLIKSDDNGTYVEYNGKKIYDNDINNQILTHIPENVKNEKTAYSNVKSDVNIDLGDHKKTPNIQPNAVTITQGVKDDESGEESIYTFTTGKENGYEVKPFVLTTNTGLGNYSLDYNSDGDNKPPDDFKGVQDYKITNTYIAYTPNTRMKNVIGNRTFQKRSLISVEDMISSLGKMVIINGEKRPLQYSDFTPRIMYTGRVLFKEDANSESIKYQGTMNGVFDKKVATSMDTQAPSEFKGSAVEMYDNLQKRVDDLNRIYGGKVRVVPQFDENSPL